MSTQSVDPINAVFKSTLLDSSGQPNLVIGSTGPNQLTWTLANNATESGQDLVITPFASGESGPSQFHFSFTFAPGALTATPVVQGWDVAADLDAQNAIVSLYVALHGTAALSIPPQGATQAQITYTNAIQEDTGSSQVQVTLAAGTNVTLGGTSIENKQFGPFALTLVPAGTPSLSVPPISVDFVGRRTVLNDGQTPNSFTFALTNLTTVDLDLTSSAVFTVWFDAAPNNPTIPYPWALAQVQDLAASSVALSAPSWNVTRTVDRVTQVVTGNPQWQLTPKNKVTLRPQEPVCFVFSGIVTDLDPGITRMYLRFQNLPGYADGILMAELEKSPLLYGATRGQGLYLSAGAFSGSTPPEPNFGSGLYVRQFASAPAATLHGGAGLLVQNTTGPAATLEGALQVNGRATTMGDAMVGGNLAVDGTATITGTATVGGVLTANAGASINVGTQPVDALVVTAEGAQPAVSIQQSGSGPALQVGGEAKLQTLEVSAEASVSGTLTGQGAANVAGLLTANGGATLNGTVSVPGPVSMFGAHQGGFQVGKSYTASTDGFVLATVSWPSGQHPGFCVGYLFGYVNGTVMAHATGGNMGAFQVTGSTFGNVSAQNTNSLLLPVPRGARWQVNLIVPTSPRNQYDPTSSVFWVPLGTSQQESAIPATEGVQPSGELLRGVMQTQESDVRTNIASLVDELGGILGRPITGEAASRLQESIYRIVQVRSAGGA